MLNTILSDKNVFEKADLVIQPLYQQSKMDHSKTTTTIWCSLSLFKKILQLIYLEKIHQDRVEEKLPEALEKGTATSHCIVERPSGPLMNMGINSLPEKREKVTLQQRWHQNPCYQTLLFSYSKISPISCNNKSFQHKISTEQERQVQKSRIN